MKLLKNLLLSLAVITMVMGPGMAFGEVIPLFIDDVDSGIWNAKIEDSSPSNMNDAVTAPAGFGSGNVLRMLNDATDDKPELQGDLASALTGPFQLTLDSQDQSTAGNSNAIRLRMANSGDSITSESRSAFSISWQADAEFTAKYSGISDGSATDVDTLSSDPLVGGHTISMVANGTDVGGADYTYDFFGVSRTLHPQHYDVYINGVLLNDGLHPDFANGMQFTLEKSSATYDPALGLQRIGIVGSSDSNTGSDVLFDDIAIRTGDDMIPEPATLGLMLGSFALLAGLRRRG